MGAAGDLCSLRYVFVLAKKGHVVCVCECVRFGGGFGAVWISNTEVYIDQKPGLYQFANVTQQLTGQQLMDMFKSD